MAFSCSSMNWVCSHWFAVLCGRIDRGFTYDAVLYANGSDSTLLACLDGRWVEFIVKTVGDEVPMDDTVLLWVAT